MLRARHVAFALALLLHGLSCQGCREQEVVNCGVGQAYDPDLGICYTCPEGTKVDYATATCVPGCSGNQIYNSFTKKCQPCPAGTVADAKSQTCVPAADLPPPPDVAEQVEPPPEPEPDVPDVPSEQVDAPDVPDVPDLPDLVFDGSVGSPCAKDTDCKEGLSCFDWPDGYCIQAACDTSVDCPSGSACLPLLENGRACFDLCESAAECRDGYTCKTLPGLDGESASVCHPLDPVVHQVGEVCESHSGCTGALACVPLGAKKLCVQSGCAGAVPCAAPTECMQWGSMTLCLPACATDADCSSFGAGAFSCQDGKDVEGKKVKVCDPAQYGLEIGQTCLFDTECKSGYCHFLILGTCSDVGTACGSDEDCKQGVCVEKPGEQKGICSLACGIGIPCPTDGPPSLCVLLGEKAACMASCSSYGQPCGPTGLLMQCTYGTIHYPTAPSGKYACVKLPAGLAGTPCSENNDCDDGVCYKGDKDGSCATPCTSDADCPFGTLCMPHPDGSGKSYCLRICYSDLDCFEGFACKNYQYSPEKVCLL